MKKITLLILMFTITWGSAQLNCSSALVAAVGTNTAPTITGTAPTIFCGLSTTTLPTAGIWYKFTATQTASINVTTSIPGQSVDTRMIIYKGNCSALTCVTSNDDYSGGAGTYNYASEVTFSSVAGTTYYIVFDNKWTSAGFNFKVNEVVVPPDRVTFIPQSVSSAGTLNNCVVDMNGDFLDDIVSVVTATQIVISYQQPGGTFNNITYTVPTTTVTPSWSIAAGDYDNNGYNDLVYGSGSGITFVKANSTGTGFTVDRKPQSYLCQRSNFVDINNDGKLDAFICDDNAPNRYYLNDGTNMNHNQGGLGDFPTGGNYASIWTDFDNDGDMDLYIAKCNSAGAGNGGNLDELHRNNGNGTFTNVAAAANMLNPIQSWSSAWGDFNNDGWMDSVVGMNAASDVSSKVMKNNGNGTFTDMSTGSGYDTASATSREYVTHDFDNDGFLDVLSSNKIMFGNGNFTFISSNTYDLDAYNRPIGDLNNDGFLDIQKGSTIMMNAGNTNKWLKVTLKGIQSNRNGIGARVEIYGSWGKQIRDVQSGTGFRNMSSLNTHFGIGQATSITKVVVRWPSGTVDVVNNVTPNTTLHIVEGSFLDTKEVENAQDLFTIYPNPAYDAIHIKTKKGIDIVEAKVYELSGRMVLQTKVERNSISVKNLNQGDYLLVLTDKNGKTHSEKIIKK